MTTKFLEDSYEKALIALFQERLGYDYIHGPEVERDYRQPCMPDFLHDSLYAINRGIPAAAIEEALRHVLSLEDATLLQTNERFMGWLQNGMEVAVSEDGDERTYIVRLIDYEHTDKNHFCVTNQWAVEDLGKIRCDLVVFVNGLPLVVIELKSPSDASVDEHHAYQQMRNYIRKCPVLFGYNAFCVTSDMFSTHAGTITAKEERYMEWKTKDGRYEDSDTVSYDTFFEGIFPKARFLDILHNFICFESVATDSAAGHAGNHKIMAGYHQYFAVNKALKRTYEALSGDHKIGVFWHTQGSGKSLSMVFFAHLLLRHFSESTIVVVTDRTDLDTQLYGQFARCADFLRQQPLQAGSRAELGNLLRDRKAGGIIFTTIQKFEEYGDPSAPRDPRSPRDPRYPSSPRAPRYSRDSSSPSSYLSDRSNIIVMTDEAHRSQYGDTVFDLHQERLRKGYAKLMREALPNASFIGFTGTPISNRDKDTQEVFGDYIDIYDMTQSVRDHATLPVYYESRAIKLGLNKEVLEKLDKEFDVLAAAGATDAQLDKSKHDLSRLEEVLGAPETIHSLTQDIVYHYIANRQQELTGKVMVVALNRRIAMKIYEEMLRIRPDWKNKVKVVMTASNQDPEEWHSIIGNDAYKKELAAEFKREDSEMKIAIVVDMWLTGFDVPSLSTMYVYKPMSGHNLMQAIARVNRVFPEKEGGLVVDYVGIAQALKDAMKQYTSRDRKQFGDPDIQKTAFCTFQEKLEICRDLMHGYNYSSFMTSSDAVKAALIKGGVNFLCHPSRVEARKAFIREASLLHNATTLCRSLLSEELKLEVAYMDAVRVLLMRLEVSGTKITKREINERIAALLQQSVQSEGIVTLFSDQDKEFNLFDEAFLTDIRNMKEKNLAVQILEKLLKGVISGYKHTNIVQSQKFSEMLSSSLSSYLKGLLSNEEVIEELMKLAAQIKEAEQQGNDLGLNKEEKAFYDALTQPEMVRKAYSDEEFIALTRELTETLRQNRTIDWNQKESARAQMRRMVKRLLKKYNYPPEGQEAALVTVMEQCNQWTECEYTE